MIFAEPLPFSEAAQILLEKGLLPTDMSSAELRALDAQVRNRAVFMARLTKAEILQTLQDGLAEMVAGTQNTGTIRARLQDHFDALGYEPESGFPDDRGDRIPPAERGSLRDLSSDKRLNLVLKTNTRLVGNEAFKRAGQTDFALYAWPCYELVRVGVREVPRGEKRVKGELVEDEENGWPARWEKAGGSFYGGRMIARKDDPIWTALGDGDLFADGMDVEVPPFCYNSGMGWREVEREECVRLGVIDAATEIAGAQSQRATAVAASAKIDPSLLDAAIADLDVLIADGKARLQNPGALTGPARALGAVGDFTRPARTGLLANSASWDEYLHPRGAKGRFVRSAVARDIKALRRAVRISQNQKRDMPEVITRGELRFDLDHGIPGDPKAVSDDGYGVAHLVKHPREKHRMPVTLSRGSIHAHENPLKIYVVRGNDVAILKQKPRNDGGWAKTRYGFVTHFEDAKTARRASQRAVLVEGR